MKKQFLSIALVLCMMLAVLPTAVIVQAATPTGTALTQDNIGSYTNLTGGSTENDMAYYYLAEDVTTTFTVEISGYVTLDLNGHVLKMNSKIYDSSSEVTGSVIKVGYATGISDFHVGHLTLQDSNPNEPHTYTVDSDTGLWKLDSAGTNTLTGGVITGGNKDNSGGSGGGVIVNQQGSTFTMTGGNIIGCTTNSNGGGVCVGSNNATFNMDGGLIAGCTAIMGGGVAVVSGSNGTFTMTGGTIKDCKTTGTTHDSYTLRNIDGCVVNANGGDIYGVVCNSGTIGNTSTENNVTTFHDAVYNEVIDISSACTVNGGIFKGDVVNTPITRIDDYDVEIWPSISGGEFYGEVTVNYTFEGTTYTMPSGNITGGIFYGGVDTGKISSDATWYEVKFDTNGGSRAPVTQVFVNVDDAKALKPTDPTRTGYTFVGWYEKDANGAFKDTSFDFANTKVTDDITLYAKWVCNHSGGTADCTHKAKCEVCGEEYGEVNAANHTTLKHIEAKAATAEAEGNIEYWYCEECGKYFSDKDGKNEISLADTVIAKLENIDSETSESEVPQTGDNSHTALWLVLLFISGGTLVGITAYDKKKKCFVK